MRTRTWATVGAIVAVFATVAGAAAQATPRSGPGGSVIHLVSGAGGRNQFFDFDNDGLGFGDRLVARGGLTNAGGRRVGTMYGDCLIVSEAQAGGKYLCRWLLDITGGQGLGHGQITTEGLDPQGVSDTFFSVTGGTGAYMEAEGQAEFVDTPEQTDIYITLAPTG